MMEKASVGCLAEVFRCFICMEKLKEAHLCPHCSKPCCYPCIRKWLTQHSSQCPHCRVTLHMDDLVNCRWIEEVTQQIDFLRLVENNAKIDVCGTHNEKLTVFCVLCKQSICHQCALWDKTHANHVFKPLEEVCLQHVVKMDEELLLLRRRHSELKNSICEVEKNVQKVKRAKSERLAEIIHFTSQMGRRLEEQLEKNLSTLIAQKNLWAEENAEIELILKSADKQKNSCSKSELLVKSEKVMQRIEEFKLKPLNVLENSFVVPDNLFPSMITPPYEGSAFVISNFSVHQLAKDPIYSQPFEASGLTWHLKVYPAGNGLERGKYLSVHFKLTSGYPETSKYQYKVKMPCKESANSSDAVVREFTSDFDVGECWGFNRFYPLDLLACEGYLNEECDTLVLDFQVRPMSYYQKCRDQAWYINQLQTEKNQ